MRKSPIVFSTLKRKIFETLSVGVSRQLVWFISISAVVLVIGFIVEKFVFVDKPLGWSGLIALFFEPSGFAREGVSEARIWFRFAISFFGFFFFSTLLVSVLTNVFNNISDSVKSGLSRYRFKNHVLILGAGHQLNQILSMVKGLGKNVVVISAKNLDLNKQYVYYHGDFSDETLLNQADAALADTIYLIGDDDGFDYDSRHLRCLEQLKKICVNKGKKINCYVMLRERTSLEVLFYQKINFSSDHLLVDTFYKYEFMAEQLLVESAFLPVIKEDDDRRSHIFLLGANDLSSAMAYTAAHISHYPNFVTKKLKTCITIVDENCSKFMDKLVAAKPGLFNLSKYVFVDENGNEEVHGPSAAVGDFLDVEWRFVQATPDSPLARNFMQQSIANHKEAASICVCYEDSDTALNTVLHLPRFVYGEAKIALYWPNESRNIVNLANDCGMYGQIQVFGNLEDVKKYSHAERIKRGQRVNAVYSNNGHAMASDEAESIWYKESEYGKNSSIYCANAMYFRYRCFGSEKLSWFSEVEHNRWMMSVLLMGWFAGTEKDKARFIHSYIVPFNKLPLDIQRIDDDLVKNMDYIVEGK